MAFSSFMSHLVTMPKLPA